MQSINYKNSFSLFAGKNRFIIFVHKLFRWNVVVIIWCGCISHAKYVSCSMFSCWVDKFSILNIFFVLVGVQFALCLTIFISLCILLFLFVSLIKWPICLLCQCLYRSIVKQFAFNYGSTINRNKWSLSIKYNGINIAMAYNLFKGNIIISSKCFCFIYW